MQKHHLRDILFTEEEIHKRVCALVNEMDERHTAENFVMIGILRGSFIFLADLIREMYRHGAQPRVDFTALESYGGGTTSSGTVTVGKEVSLSIEGADVLVVDDILDTGRTMSFAVRHLIGRGARTVRSCVLLDKPSRRVVPIEADYVGFRIEDVFVAGYGLDYDGRYRELPYIVKVTFED